MKMTQAYAWLVAGVLAAGLNASYHDGGLPWAHEIAGEVEHNSAAVLDVASGHADQLLTQMRVVTGRQEAASCPLSTALARVQTRLAQSELAKSPAGFDRLEAMADREQARVERMEARRARIEVQSARIRIPATVFAPMAFSTPSVSECPRIRLDVPRLPTIQVPEVPVIHVETASAGPV
ncbi:MAG TPA: hypothetical protein VKF84_11720 [Candidatus Sulfotelmatobacter sp.]|nr:hypothetical protein [Candidatus Sulfotelmatobacter sp.]